MRRRQVEADVELPEAGIPLVGGGGRDAYRGRGGRLGFRAGQRQTEQQGQKAADGRRRDGTPTASAEEDARREEGESGGEAGWRNRHRHAPGKVMARLLYRSAQSNQGRIPVPTPIATRSLPADFPFRSCAFEYASFSPPLQFQAGPTLIGNDRSVIQSHMFLNLNGRRIRLQQFPPTPGSVRGIARFDTRSAETAPLKLARCGAPGSRARCRKLGPPGVRWPPPPGRPANSAAHLVMGFSRMGKAFPPKSPTESAQRFWWGGGRNEPAAAPGRGMRRAP